MWSYYLRHHSEMENRDTERKEKIIRNEEGENKDSKAKKLDTLLNMNFMNDDIFMCFLCFNVISCN